MIPSYNVQLFFLLWMTAYGETLTISSTEKSTDFDSVTLAGQTINSLCETTYQCSGKMICVSGQCQCSENHIWNGTNCIEEKTFNSKCKHTTECETTLFCMYGTCQCARMHFWNGNTCLPKKTANDTCTNSNECGGKLLCEDGVCQCHDDLFWNGNTCIFKKFDGHSCSSSIECAENLECSNFICRCSESEYWDNSNALQVRYQCLFVLALYVTCFMEKHDLRSCTRIEYLTRKKCKRCMSICQCASSDYWTGATCSLKKDENSLCDSPLECKATLQCRDKHCVCCEQDFWNGQFCETKRNITFQCQESVQCIDTLHCIRGTCQCDVTEYWTETACAKKSNLFEDLHNMMRNVTGLVAGFGVSRKDIPAFSASLSGSKTFSKNENVKFDTVWSNVRNGYNATSGIFTAPQSGVYQFSCTLMRSGNTIRVHLWKNEMRIVSIYAGSSDVQPGSLNTVLQLHKGDRVSLRNAASQLIYSEAGSHFSMFSGFMISN
ncbi:unnamed protein product [Mytilus coruscus]|uniref:C1q domain-containing protein n=1 Tax=Mytilus coruscus TaxID=42192 RepID=A0A6J8CSL0_MYTCO|nr:unnamed protein product [Mytilus coruscus]